VTHAVGLRPALDSHDLAVAIGVALYARAAAGTLGGTA